MLVAAFEASSDMMRASPAGIIPFLGMDFRISRISGDFIASSGGISAMMFHIFPIIYG